MALVFPLNRQAFADRLRIAEAQPFRLQRFEARSMTAGGDLLVSELAAPKWVAEMTLSRMTYAEGAAIAGLFEALGSTGRCDLYDPTRRGPIADPTGAILGNRVVTVSLIGVNRRSIRLSGLPAAYTISAGDMISVGWSSRRVLFRASETVNASGGVTPLFDVVPHVPSDLPVGSAAVLTRAWARFVITSWQVGQAAKPLWSGMAFTAMEAD